MYILMFYIDRCRHLLKIRPWLLFGFLFFFYFKSFLSLTIVTTIIWDSPKQLQKPNICVSCTYTLSLDFKSVFAAYYVSLSYKGYFRVVFVKSDVVMTYYVLVSFRLKIKIIFYSKIIVRAVCVSDYDGIWKCVLYRGVPL